VKLRENKAIDNSASDRPSRTKLAVPGRCTQDQQFAQSYAIDVFFFDFSVPVVQRIEQGFPKGKMAFLHQSADVISSAQMAVFESLE
jgi:hypothetical protein